MDQPPISPDDPEVKIETNLGQPAKPRLLPSVASTTSPRTDQVTVRAVDEAALVADQEHDDKAVCSIATAAGECKMSGCSVCNGSLLKMLPSVHALLMGTRCEEAPIFNIVTCR